MRGLFNLASGDRRGADTVSGGSGAIEQAHMSDPSSPLRRESQGASPVALSVGDDTREAWSCPLPNEIFTVGSQGQGEEIAGVGVAIALHRLLAAGSTPARHESQTLDPVPLCLPPH